MSLEKDIIEEVKKYHNMEMSNACVKALINILKKH